ncbi:periplasmic chaperone for outer membrane proteins Skp [Winogradskyella eximia]|jgi:outer membrane protein|uniref:Periplasmic chaperone for outer membrane proteins Skp n=1 Tax=Winogradskyella eximia TaxID=262006 RepID=A0A3D9HA54_9FLAO|nr:OmpH family outer membrane protein [Winogradskyella eximia]RED46363.1 periplasmic chaperone for outer membrane proteins Skp [Winogradskyella eximia]|tara:strand:- start:1975 stop:2538 length:564 start_codon:yes stop_codon:yes gene_type:complete
MKKIILSLTVLVALASCQEQQKIAFVDNGKVINDYQMKIDIEDKFKQKDEVFKLRMDSIGKAFQAEAQAFQAKEQSLSAKARQEMYQSLTQKQQGLQQQFQYEQQQMQQLFSVEMDSVISKVNTFVNDYGKKNGYTYILGKNEAGSVMFGKEENDISEAVTKAINAAYGEKETKTEDKSEVEATTEK